MKREAASQVCKLKLRDVRRGLSKLCVSALCLSLMLTGFISRAQAAPPQFVLDQTFGTNGIVRTAFDFDDTVQDLLRQPDGKIIAVGTTTHMFQSGFQYHTSLARYNVDGSLDTGFGTNGKVTVPSGSSGVAGALQPDGKILSTGRTDTGLLIGNLTLARYNNNGSLDGSFGGGSGVVSPGYNKPAFGNGIALQPDGKILVSGGLNYNFNGTAFAFLVVRFNSNGSLDASFGTNGSAATGIGTDSFASSVFVRPDGRILLAGYGTVSNQYQFALAQYTSTGALDNTFGSSGVVTTVFPSYNSSSISSGKLQPDGKLVAVGLATGNFALARYNTNGSLDSTFGTGGLQTTYFSVDSRANAVTFLPDGRIVAGGSASADSLLSSNNFALALYTNNGKLISKTVTELSIDADTIRALLAQPDGKIIAGGSSRQAGGDDFALARYKLNAAPPTQFDFDGDGKADFAVYRPGGTQTAPSYWYVLRSSNYTFQGVQFGRGEDVIVPADFDGDGVANMAVWRPSNGTWYTSQNQAINYGAFVWGQSGDIPLPADFDGDGKADFAVYRPGNTKWYVYKSSNGGLIREEFGTNTSQPLLGDFDGDGKSDLAYAVTTNGELDWYIWRSIDNEVVVIQFGQATDKAVPMDFDGDGITNIAIYRPSTGKWYTSTNASINFAEQQWGGDGDAPAAADYDGDGSADLTIFRPNLNTWYILKSSDGTIIGQQWGLASDTLVESAYVR